MSSFSSQKSSRGLLLVIALLASILTFSIALTEKQAKKSFSFNNGNSNSKKHERKNNNKVMNHCMYKCLIVRQHTSVRQCELYCNAIESYYYGGNGSENKNSKNKKNGKQNADKELSDNQQQQTATSAYWPRRHLLIVDNGVAINEHMTPVTTPLNDNSNNVYHASAVRFDKNLFNTPNAFDELFQWTRVLQQKLGVVISESVNPGSPSSNEQFHLLPMPVPLSSDQLNNHRFMSRLLDVVPESDIIYRETSPLMFSEAYKQFLLDINIDPNTQLNQQDHSPEVMERIRAMEAQIASDMSQFLAYGDLCYAAYEAHLSAHQLKRVSYTFDQFAATNSDCLAADQHLALHALHSDELSEYLKSLNPYDALFTAIGAVSQNRADWSFERDEIEQFKNGHIQAENSGQAPQSPIRANIDIMRYYFNQNFFGASTKVEESCEIASLSFSAQGWKEVNVSPKDTWFKPHVVTQYKDQGTKSGRNYIDAGGLMQRYVSKMIVAYKPVLHIKVSAAMKSEFINRSAYMGYRPLEVGPFIFDRVEFTQVHNSNAFESYEMKIECRTQEPQVIGMRSKTFTPIHVPLPSTHYAAACQSGNFCMKRMSLVALHRFYANGHHFFTTNFAEGAGKSYEGIAGHCLPNPVPGSIPLYRYYQPGANQHLYTVTYGEVSTAPIVKKILFFKKTLPPAWNYEGVVCHLHSSQVAGSTPLYRYYHRANDRLITTNFGELGGGGNGWSYEGVIGYLYPMSEVDQAISCCKCD